MDYEWIKTRGPGSLPGSHRPEARPCGCVPSVAVLPASLLRSLAKPGSRPHTAPAPRCAASSTILGRSTRAVRRSPLAVRCSPHVGLRPAPSRHTRRLSCPCFASSSPRPWSPLLLRPPRPCGAKAMRLCLAARQRHAVGKGRHRRRQVQDTRPGRLQAGAAHHVAGRPLHRRVAARHRGPVWGAPALLGRLQDRGLCPLQQGPAAGFPEAAGRGTRRLPLPVEQRRQPRRGPGQPAISFNSCQVPTGADSVTSPNGNPSCAGGLHAVGRMGRLKALASPRADWLDRRSSTP